MTVNDLEERENRLILDVYMQTRTLAVQDYILGRRMTKYARKLSRKVRDRHKNQKKVQEEPFKVVVPPGKEQNGNKRELSLSLEKLQLILIQIPRSVLGRILERKQKRR